jgi:hypothetical protein
VGLASAAASIVGGGVEGSPASISGGAESGAGAAASSEPAPESSTGSGVAGAAGAAASDEVCLVAPSPLVSSPQAARGSKATIQRTGRITRPPPAIASPTRRAAFSHSFSRRR